MISFELTNLPARFSNSQLSLTCYAADTNKVITYPLEILSLKTTISSVVWNFRFAKVPIKNSNQNVSLVVGHNAEVIIQVNSLTVRAHSGKAKIGSHSGITVDWASKSMFFL